MAAAIALALVVRRLSRRSGVSGAEASARLPGDEVVPRPRWASTRGITIHTSPDEVWPWIVQMGY
ncbi:MAG TPA: hypothetical protein VHK00_03455, partial [Miltoncostaeaceae bacterium]|nr:hypothetical protein [Miltoncostaeaceae bacterium]